MLSLFRDNKPISKRKRPALSLRKARFEILEDRALLSTITQMTSGSTDHRWPSLNNNGDIVYNAEVNGVWQVFLNDQQVTTDQYNSLHPVISDNRTIVYAKEGEKGGILGDGWMVIRRSAAGQESVIGRSTANLSTWQSRDVGHFVGIASDSTDIWTYDWHGDGQRRFNVSGIGRLSADFRGDIYPDINTAGDIVYVESWRAAIHKADVSVVSPNDGDIVGSGSMARINDTGDIVSVTDGRVQVTYTPNYDPTQRTVVKDGFWADIDNLDNVVFEALDPDGFRQVYFWEHGPDIAATSLEWSDGQDGVDFGYRVRPGFSGSTTASFFWSSNSTFEPTIDGDAIYEVSVEQNRGDYGPFYVANSELLADFSEGPPEGTTHLLFVVDPPSPGLEDGTIEEGDETNNVKALKLFDIQMISASTTDFQEITFQYRIVGADAFPFDLQFFLSENETYEPSMDGTPIFQGRIDVPSALTANEPEPHTPDPIILPSRAAISDAKRFVLVVADPLGQLPESKNDNNVAFVVPLFDVDEKMNRVGVGPRDQIGYERGSDGSGSATGTVSFPIPPDQLAKLVDLTTVWPPSSRFDFEPERSDEIGDHKRAQKTLELPTARLLHLIIEDLQRLPVFWEGHHFTINDAFSLESAHGENSLHKQARALDIDVDRDSGGEGDIDRLGRLAGLAWLAGFDFVICEIDHVHVSKRLDPQFPLNTTGSIGIRLNSPANLLMTAPDGRRSGVDPVTGETVLEIPGTAFNGPGAHPQILTVESPADGGYILEVVGTDSGDFTLDITAIDGDAGVAHTQVSDTTFQSAVTTYTLEYGAESASSMRLLGEANLPPVAFPDTAFTDGTSVLIDVLQNDSDPDAELDPTTVRIESKPVNGTATVSVPSGEITYVPNVYFGGTDPFTYVVGDNEGAFSEPAVVNVDVSLVGAWASGTVFEDLNRDGGRDPGEPGLGGWAVEIQPANADALMHTFHEPAFTPTRDPVFSFGRSLVAVGSNVLVGAPYASIGEDRGGAAYLFDGVTGSKLRTFVKPSPIDDDRFGGSVAAVGDDVLIGAYYDSTDRWLAGAAYLFDGSAGNLLHTFRSPTPDMLDYFGASVAGVGSHVVVGAWGEGRFSSPPFAGAVHVFDSSNGQRLFSIPNPEPDRDDRFGISVAAVGDKILVGANGDDTGAPNAGAAYLFDGSTGRRLLTFENPTPDPDDRFGSRVASVGNNVLVGAWSDDTAAPNAGAVYLFDGFTGELLHTFFSPNPSADGHFGTSVASVGDKLVIGASRDDTGALDAGAAYLFDPLTGDLLYTFRNPTPATDDRFGSSVAGVGTNVLISAPSDDTAAVDSGAVYLLETSHQRNVVVTGAEGAFTFAGLEPARYDVAEIREEGFSQTSPESSGIHTITVSDEGALTDIDFGNMRQAVVGRYVFYNNSSFDGSDPVANADDDAAIAPDKTALLPGETATAANYSNYSRGVNGLIVDIAGLPDGTQLSIDHFQFRKGSITDPGSWESTPPPTRIDVRADAGVGGSGRVSLAWTEGAVIAGWLEVTVLPANTGLAEPDVFYFANMPGDADGDGSVDLSDFNLWNATKFTQVGLDAVADFDRSGAVDLSDFNLWNAHKFTSLATATDPVPPSDAAFRLLGEETAHVDPFLANPAWLDELAQTQVARRESDSGNLPEQSVRRLLATYWR